MHDGTMSQDAAFPATQESVHRSALLRRWNACSFARQYWYCIVLQVDRYQDGCGPVEQYNQMPGNADRQRELCVCFSGALV